MSETPRTDAVRHNAAELGVFCRQLERENAAMRQALSLIVPTCESLHHPSAYRHTATMPCKACDVVRKAMAL